MNLSYDYNKMNNNPPFLLNENQRIFTLQFFEESNNIIKKILQEEKLCKNLNAKVGDIIKINAKVTRAFHSSMEIFVEVWAKKVLTQKEYLISEAYFTFVAIDDNANPTPVMHINPKTDREKAEFIAAEGRKKARLSN